MRHEQKAALLDDLLLEMIKCGAHACLVPFEDVKVFAIAEMDGSVPHGKY